MQTASREVLALSAPVHLVLALQDRQIRLKSHYVNLVCPGAPAEPVALPAAGRAERVALALKASRMKERHQDQTRQGADIMINFVGLEAESWVQHALSRPAEQSRRSLMGCGSRRFRRLNGSPIFIMLTPDNLWTK